MHKIFKYPLLITDVQVVKMPEGAEILTAMNQFETLCLWAEIDTVAHESENFIEKIIYVVGTGNPMPRAELKYINSVAFHEGRLIFHVFEGI